MEFKEPYLLALREQDPKLFMDLVRSGQIEAHLQQKSQEAHAMLRQILGNDPEPSQAKRREAEEIVRATLIEFQEPESQQNPEPPDDLPSHPGK